jgi:hypothetical protein
MRTTVHSLEFGGYKWCIDAKIPEVAPFWLNVMFLLVPSSQFLKSRLDARKYGGNYLTDPASALISVKRDSHRIVALTPKLQQMEAAEIFELYPYFSGPTLSNLESTMAL